MAISAFTDERAVLLDGALRAAASRAPVPVHAGDAAERLPALIAAAPVTAALAIFHTAFLAHLPALDRERFEHLVVVLSTARPIYWIQAEPRRDPNEPRLRLTVCENGSVTREWPLGHYQPHGAWLQWLAGRVPAVTGPVRPGNDQKAGLPFSRIATLPAATASRQAAIRRASNGVTKLATSSGSVKANPASSPSASTTASISAADSTPP